MRRHPFGLDHPTWPRPQNFHYDTAVAAQEAIEKVYGPDSGHVVIGDVAQARIDALNQAAARRVAAEAADRFRDVLSECLGHADENPGDDALVAEVRAHFGKSGPEPRRWRDFLAGARAQVDQIDADRAAAVGSLRDEGDTAAGGEVCPGCGNRFYGDNLCMVSACQWEGIESPPPTAEGGEREALVAVLGPLIGAHADIAANHVLAAGYRRTPRTDDNPKCEHGNSLSDLCAFADRRANVEDEGTDALAEVEAMRERVLTWAARFRAGVDVWDTEDERDLQTALRAAGPEGGGERG